MGEPRLLSTKYILCCRNTGLYIAVQQYLWETKLFYAVAAAAAAVTLMSSPVIDSPWTLLLLVLKRFSLFPYLTHPGHYSYCCSVISLLSFSRIDPPSTLILLLPCFNDAVLFQNWSTVDATTTAAALLQRCCLFPEITLHGRLYYCCSAATLLSFARINSPWTPILLLLCCNAAVIFQNWPSMDATTAAAALLAVTLLSFPTSIHSGRYYCSPVTLLSLPELTHHGRYYCSAVTLLSLPELTHMDASPAPLPRTHAYYFPVSHPLFLLSSLRLLFPLRACSNL